jgi:hypothetical protein
MSTTFSRTPRQIITAALIKQGWLDYTATPDATKVSQMQDSLQAMIKGWSSRGIRLWCIQQITVALVDGQAAYTLGPPTYNKALRIEEAFLRNTSGNPNNDQILVPFSRQEYEMLGNKFSPGVASSYWLNPQTTYSVITLYPVPNSSVASTYTLYLDIRQLIEDVSDLDAVIAFPSEWFQCLVWGLAAETADDNQIPEQKALKLQGRAEELLDQMDAWDTEHTSIFIQADRSRMSR